MRALEKTRTRIAGVMLAAFTVWQISTLVHLVSVVHAICPHGKIVDINDSSEHPDSNDRSSDHDDCAFLTAFTVARTIIVDGTPDVLAAQMATDTVPTIEDHVVIGDDLYMLAPSNSPPVAI
jgi:hypothetical protein